MFRIRVAIVLTIACAAVASVGQAQGVVAGPNPNLPGTHIDIDQDPNVSAGGFTLGSTSNPIPVSYDPTVGPLEKWLNFEPDQNGDGVVDGSDVLVVTATAYPLHEHFVVGQGPAWTDWHEEIATPGWEWGNVQFEVGGAPAPGLTIQHMGEDVWFFFDPLSPGTRVDIWKDLRFVGDPSTLLGDLLNDTLMVKVVEYPTAVPEPASGLLALVGLFGSAATLRCRWVTPGSKGEQR